jgi:hypothetical protein
MPNWNIAGTVIKEVLPVTTLMMLVKKKIVIKINNWKIVNNPNFHLWVALPNLPRHYSLPNRVPDESSHNQPQTHLPDRGLYPESQE